jgi:hypothetical protein
MARLSPWNEDGALTSFGVELNAAAKALVEASVTLEWSEADKDVALSLAMVAVLDGLSDWALETVQAYIAKEIRPGVPWASIAGATNRAPDAARMRFDPRQAALREKRLAAQSQ